MKSKIIFTSLFTLFFCFSVFSQKLKVISGDFNFLKGQKEINVIFDYSGVTFYQKNLSEAEYISKRSDEIKEKSPNEDWVETWKLYKDTKFPEKFFASANKYINKSTLVFEQNKTTPYTLIVKTDWIKPGSPMWSKAQVSTTLKFVDSRNYANVLLTILCEKAPGKSYVPHRNVIISESYAMTGKELAQLLNKKIK